MQSKNETAVRDRLLTVIALVALGAALKATYSVTMPIAFAAVVLAAIWPLKRWLERWIPAWASYIVSLLVLACLFVAFLAAVYVSAGQLVAAITARSAEFQDAEEVLTRVAARLGMPSPGDLGATRLIGLAGALASHVFRVATYSGFIALLVALGLPEISRLRHHVFGDVEDQTRRELREALSAISGQVRRYFATTAATSLLTGLASALWALATGLDLALVWGLLNFLLNFVPVIGNIIGIIPPSLYALVQFHDPAMAAIVFVGFTALQLVISNVVFPLFAGRQLSLSPLVVVLAMSFWGWLWGVAGALIAVPLTAATTIVCRQFERTEWLARLLSA